MTLRPPRWAIWIGVVISVGGVLFALAGLAEPDDLGTLIIMAIAGLVFAFLGSTGATASAKVSRQGITYRNGMIVRRIPSSDIESITVGAGSGAYYERIALIVNRHNGRPVRLTAVQRPATSRGRREFAQRAAEIAAIVRS